MCLNIYELDSAKFISALELAWQAALKRTVVELDLLTDIDMLLMVEKGIRRGVCNSFHWYTKANNKYTKNYDIRKESSYINYLEVNNLYGWAMSQKLPAFNFEWIEDISQFTEVFIKSYDEKSEVGYILEADVQLNYLNFILTCHFYQKERNLEKSKSLVLA